MTATSDSDCRLPKGKVETLIDPDELKQNAPGAGRSAF